MSGNEIAVSPHVNVIFMLGTLAVWGLPFLIEYNIEVTVNWLCGMQFVWLAFALYTCPVFFLTTINKLNNSILSFFLMHSLFSIISITGWLVCYLHFRSYLNNMKDPDHKVLDGHYLILQGAVCLLYLVAVILVILILPGMELKEELRTTRAFLVCLVALHVCCLHSMLNHSKLFSDIALSCKMIMSLWVLVLEVLGLVLLFIDQASNAVVVTSLLSVLGYYLLLISVPYHIIPKLKIFNNLKTLNEMRRGNQLAINAKFHSGDRRTLLLRGNIIWRRAQKYY